MEGQQGGEGMGRVMEKRKREGGSRRESGRIAKRNGVRVNAPSSSQGCFLVILYGNE